VHGKEPSGTAWQLLELVMDFYTLTQMIAAPPSTPKPVVADLVKGYLATLADPAFKAEYGKRSAFVPEPAPRAQVDRTIASLRSIDPKLVAAMRAHVEAKTTAK
jgi:hypothetical protein